MIFVAVTLSGAAAVPPKATCSPGAPKCVPWIVTTVPTAPDVGEKLEIVGGDVDAASEPAGAASKATTRAIPRVRRATRFPMDAASRPNSSKSIGRFPT